MTVSCIVIRIKFVIHYYCITHYVKVFGILQGNIQRCQQFVARLDEARAALLSVTDTHKQRVADIIGRHQSKRIVKKKERL